MSFKNTTENTEVTEKATEKKYVKKELWNEERKEGRKEGRQRVVGVERSEPPVDWVGVACQGPVWRVQP